MSALAERADLAALSAELERRRLLPLLGGRLVEASGGHLPPAFAERVARAHARDRAAAMALLGQTMQVVDELAQQRVTAVPLKGPGLAGRLYADIGLRSAGDIDLLVAGADLGAATDVVRARGYAAPRDHVDREGRPHLHFAMRDSIRPMVEVHWRVHWHEEAFSRDLLAHAAPGPEGLLVPVPVDEVAALLLFFARDGFHGLRMAADIATWWDRHASPGAVGILDGHARRYPELERSWRAAALAAERVTGVPARAWVTAAAPDRRVRLAVRLASWSGTGDHDQLVANVALVDGLLAPTSSLRQYARRQVLGAPGSLVAHLAKVGARFLRALWRVRRRPWDPLPADRAPAAQ